MNSFIIQILFILVCAVAVLIGVFVYRFTLNRIDGNTDVSEHNPDEPSADLLNSMRPRDSKTAVGTSEKEQSNVVKKDRQHDVKPIRKERVMRSRGSRTAATPEKEAENEKAE